MGDQFSIDPKSRTELKKFFKKAPKAFQRVSGGVLQRMAMDQSRNMKREIGKRMIIRNPKLVKNSIRFKAPKTIKNKPIHKQETSAFSLKRARHDGWENVEDGDTKKMTLFTVAGRGGNRQNPSKPSFRDKKGAHTGPQDFGLPLDMSDVQIVRYLQRISASPQRRRKTWFLPAPGYKGMPGGIYKFIGGSVNKIGKGKFGKKKGGRRTLVGAKIVMVSNPQVKAKLKKLEWNAKALTDTMKQDNIKDIWLDNFEHEMRKVLIK